MQTGRRSLAARSCKESGVSLHGPGRTDGASGYGGSVPVKGRSRWLALYVLCLGDIMIVLDSTIVNVALPSIRDDLGFSQTSLAWVVNAYLLTFGGFLLLGGRLGDLYGHRRLFLIGISVFTMARSRADLPPPRRSSSRLAQSRVSAARSSRSSSSR